MTQYIKWDWRRDGGWMEGMPEEVYVEIDEDNVEIRRVCRFSDDTWGYADKNSWNGCMPAEGPIDMEVRPRDGKDLNQEYIAQDEFEEVWQLALKSRPPVISMLYGVQKP